MGTQCLLWMAVLCGTIAVTISGSDFGEAVYHGCSEARYAQGSAYESNLNKLMVSILSQTPSNGYRNVSVGAGNSVVSGLFQCRGDLGDADCFECKKSAVARAPRLCGGAVGARVQLRGCYLRYDNGAQFMALSDSESPMYKACSPEVTADPGFFRGRDDVFENLENETLESNGFQSTNSEGDPRAARVSGTAQCAGDLPFLECGYCVVKAVQELKDACGASVRGQVYLEKCHVTYSMDNASSPSQPSQPTQPTPHQAPSSKPSSEPSSKPSSKSNHVDSKTIAIVIGGVAAAIFVFVFLLFLKSLYKNED